MKEEIVHKKLRLEYKETGKSLLVTYIRSRTHRPRVGFYSVMYVSNTPHHNSVMLPFEAFKYYFQKHHVDKCLYSFFLNESKGWYFGLEIVKLCILNVEINYEIIILLEVKPFRNI